MNLMAIKIFVVTLKKNNNFVVVTFPRKKIHEWKNHFLRDEKLAFSFLNTWKRWKIGVQKVCNTEYIKFKNFLNRSGIMTLLHTKLLKYVIVFLVILLLLLLWYAIMPPQLSHKFTSITLIILHLICHVLLLEYPSGFSIALITYGKAIEGFEVLLLLIDLVV